MESNDGVHFFRNAQGVTVENSHFISAGHDYVRYEIAGDYHTHNYDIEEGESRIFLCTTCIKPSYFARIQESGQSDSP